jgi:hypothetical protein
MAKLREIGSPLDRMSKTSSKIVMEPNKRARLVKYNWIQRLIKKIFKV